MKPLNKQSAWLLGLLGSFLTVSSCTPSFPDLDAMELVSLATLASNSTPPSIPSTASILTINDSGLTTSENGAIATFQVLLNSKPNANVTLSPVTSLDTSEGTPFTTSLTFTPTNWDTPQNIQVQGSIDDFDAVDTPYALDLGTTSSTDASWNGIAGGNVTLTNLDSALINLHRSFTSATYASISGTGTAVPFPSTDNSNWGLSIGFNFVYQGVTYASIYASTNGFASFNTTGVSSPNNADLFVSGGSIADSVLAPWWDDLNTVGGAAYYQTVGTAPNREFILEWNNVTDAVTTTNLFNFQIHLYETSNIIEFQYGPQSGTNLMTASIGVNDATGGTSHFIEGLTASTDTGIDNLNYNYFPTANRIIRFTPP